MEFSNHASGRQPLISVVIPAYNCATYIAQAVASVLNQEFQDVETIVVNNDSPDTPLLESELRPYRDKIRYLKHSTRGPSAARNAGIRESKAKYIAFLDGDDFWRPGHLARMMRLFDDNSALALTYCDCVLLKRDRAIGTFFEAQPQAEEANFNSILVGTCVMATSTVVVLREAVLKAGLFDEALHRCEDFDLWLRLAFQQAAIAYHTGSEVLHRVNQTGQCSNRIAMKQGLIQVYEKVLTTLSVTPEQEQVVRKIIARTEEELRIEQMKSALAAGDYDTARRLSKAVNGAENNWKVNFTRIFMRTAPRLLRQIFLYRARLLGDQTFFPASLGATPPTDTDSRDRPGTAG